MPYYIPTNLLPTSQVGKPGFIGLVGACRADDSFPQSGRQGVACSLESEHFYPIGTQHYLDLRIRAQCLLENFRELE
ncbi:hypothetical protein LMG23994_05107 [Cupriavidus pinatubonensis]|uniref:Uncharacterized protein n=1 Tax=Cupriavidus pinatubonensis TaxID=248026 RepID=A0ABM8XSI7_9BURK|nr:hypothetical protein LMG23994_05107 [Cupriavidus pinatubonensis]